MWYASLGITMLIILFIVVEVFPTDLPIWALCITLLITALMTVPVGIFYAITNQLVQLNLVSELIGGYLLPGRPIAIMIFKATATAGANQAVGFSGDLKLGHYMKVPPRLMFLAQVIAAFVGSIVVTSVQNWMFSNIVDFCHPDQPQHLTCLHTKTFATASLVLGGIGPHRLFSPGAMYSPLLWFSLRRIPTHPVLLSCSSLSPLLLEVHQHPCIVRWT